MMQLLKFLFFFFFISGILVIASIAWPRFMGDRPKPNFLVRVYDAVKHTHWGQQAATVLGVSDDIQIEPLTLQGFTTNLVQAAVQNVGSTAQTIVTTQAVNQLMSQFDHLPQDKQLLLQQIVCRPVVYSEATMPAEIQ